MRPPMAYYGGKTSTAIRITELLPDHGHYIEPFAGSLAVLLAKAPSRMETVNDLDGDLMTFWKVLRERPADLTRVCALTPHSRAEHEASYGDLTGLDDLERARRVWVRLTQGRTGTMRKTGWRHYVDAGTSSASMPRYLAGYLERMLPVAERLAAVSLESRPALDLIAAYGRHRSSLLYVDPPYLGATRDRNYRHEMTGEAQHRELAEALHACRATIVLSGYASDLYDNDLYASWHRTTLEAGTSQGGQWASRTEVLWSNRPLRTDVPLFDLGNETLAEEGSESNECNETPCEAEECGLPVRQRTTGRRRRYCSTACRVRAHRAAKTAHPAA
ncbi:DNA adenine methylase [Streptomyces diastaticus]|uniref:DNA adenine methylase n=1 Tax=Streptomyces diastaticus TaxID=1956 RepID=UPI00378810FC